MGVRRKDFQPAYGQSEECPQRKVPAKVHSDWHPERPSPQVSHRKQAADGNCVEERPAEDSTRMRIPEMHRAEPERKDCDGENRANRLSQPLKRVSSKTQLFVRCQQSAVRTPLQTDAQSEH